MTMISIIVPFYNTSKYFNECLSSIKSQTFSDFECLLIDDGSTDSSREIAESYVKEDPRFILLNKEHIGFPQAKNLGLDKAKGEYICFIDSDDFVHPMYLELLYTGITQSKADICCCGYQFYYNQFLFDKYSNPISLHSFRLFMKMSLLYRSVPGTYMWNKLYKRSLFDNLRHEDVMALSDTIIMPHLFDRAKVVSVMSNVLYFYRPNPGNMTRYVRSKVPTYWSHRLNVHTDFSLFIYERYPRLLPAIKEYYLGTLKQCLSCGLTESNLNKNNVLKLFKILDLDLSLLVFKENSCKT